MGKFTTIPRKNIEKKMFKKQKTKVKGDKILKLHAQKQVYMYPVPVDFPNSGIS